jgi:hypothetical protein
LHSETNTITGDTMIINEQMPTLEASSEMSRIQFSVGNAALLFEILRSKMYSNPIQSICRELMSNALDSHRERYGNDDKPIQITIPSVLEPAFKVKDWGVGISPDRIQNVYTAWGNSTKRNDNTQIGGFGLGSRTPWSISDSFTCETVVDGIKYVYACVIDETKIGACIKMSETATDDTNGTEIIVPVKSCDFAAFISGTEFCTRHLKTKPTIKGGKITWQTPNYILEGSNWKISPQFGYSRQPRLVIDSIEYPLDLSQIQDSHTLRIFHAVQGDTTLAFNTGELSLSASREAVHLDKQTSDKISANAEAAYKELEATLQAKIDSSPTLKDAYINYTSLKSIISYLPKMQYKSVELSDSIYVPYMQEWGKSMTQPITASWLRFDTSSASYPIYINDLQSKALLKKQITKLFDIDSSLTDIASKPARIYIVNPSTQEDDWETKLQEKVNELHLEELGATYLSEVISLDPEKTPTPRMTVFKFENGKFSRIKYQSFKIDKNTKVLCMLYKNSYAPSRYTKHDNSSLTSNGMNYLFDDKSISIYGLDESVKPEKIKRFFPGCMSLDDYASNKFTGVKEQLLKAKAYSQLTNEAVNGKWSGLVNGLDAAAQSLNEDVKKLLAELKMQQAYATEHYDGLRRYEAVLGYIDTNEVDAWIKEHKPINCGTELDKVFRRYPLLSVIDYYGWREKLPDIVAYMGMVDERNAKKETSK